MPTAVRFPRLLGGDFGEVRRLHPASLSLELQRRSCSKAQLVLPEEEAQLPFLAFLELYTAKGSAGLYRVTNTSEPTAGSRTYTLRHAIDTLRDSRWKAQDYDFSGTMQAFLAALLSQQNVSYWQLGVCADTGHYSREGINYDSLDELLDEVRQDRNDYIFTYDFTTTPWTLNFVPSSGAAVDCELRLTRNLAEGQLRRTRDGMCNILHLSVSTTVEDETTVTYHTYRDENSIAQFGPIEGTAGVDAVEVPNPAAWAQTFLRDHAWPIVQASADGFELVKATGEAWDALDIGKTARLAAARDGFPAAFPIETLRYEQLFGDTPEKVRADLNRPLPRFSEALAKAREKAEKAGRSAGGAGRKLKEQEKKFKKFETFYTQTDEKFSWLATESEWDELAQAGHVTAFTELTRTARYVEDSAKMELPFEDWKGQWIIAHPEDAELTDDALTDKYNAWIKANPYAIYNTEYSDATRTERIISKTGINSLGGNETLASRIGQEGDRITQIVQAVGSNGEVTAASIVAAVNGSGSSVVIDADHIDLNGIVTATEFETAIASLDHVIGDFDVHGNVDVGGTLGAGAINCEGTIECASLDVNGVVVGSVALSNLVNDIGPAAASGGQITIPWTRLDGSAGTPINFNIADTQYYQDGVSAARAAGKASVSAFIVNGNNNPVSGRRTLAPGSSMTVYPATYVDGITSRNNDAALVIIAETTTITVNGWGIAAAAGGGTIVSVNVNGTPYTHTFNNYP